MDGMFPEGLTTRPLTMSDAAATTELIQVGERHFVGETFIDQADIVGMWTTQGIDLGVDSIGVFEGDVLIAGALVDDRHHLLVDVLPSHHGMGLGTALADWVEHRARARGLAYGEQEAAVADEDATALLTRRGYASTDRDWVLRMDPGIELVHHDLPPDVTIGRFDETDARAVHTVIEDAFGEWDGRIRRSYDDWRVLMLDREGADPEHFRVAKAGGEVVGAAIVHDSGGTTWIPQLATRADRRGEGIAQELLAQAFQAGRERGCAVGELSTSGRTGALGLYERLGMRVVAEFQTWHLDL
ncbi:GNAT family N-acetyltransferase [Aeromicrobium ginsengisoli]|uniref:GNAT family N-acetyltransferase n=1 Tax=Aeromicrobium ginsengisoli TaxID=363867 RepID=A0A5M4FEH6_9ACTN|nr:GNAT family N-acetyltransferase [Aeromicrobium ginsengisoli]KAA1397684.1 GNAT family N-acetyltransferase [Aeromicrobium ginsengisoli]